MNIDEMHNTLGYMVVTSGKLLIKKFNTKFSGIITELTFDQLALLHYLSRNNEKELIQQDIALAFDKTKSAILKTIDILEEKKYLKRIPDIKDRRKNLIELTEAGNKIVKKAHKIFLEEESFIKQGINKQEIDTCLKVLKKIQEKCKE